MSDIRFSDKWQNMTGRVARLLIGNIVQAWVCSRCAALVLDQDRHREWHQSSEPESDG